MYQVAPGKLAAFNTFFPTHLLPVQQRYGAILVGRWQSESDNKILAIWACESIEAHQKIQAKVAADPNSVAAQAHRRANLGPHFADLDEWMMTTTVPLEQTALSDLDQKIKPL